MHPPDPLLQISAFARSVGVTPSMLRFYDDCGLVRPRRVDPATGYRSYSPDQADRVLLVRRLRELGLPLAEVARLLESPPEAAERAVDRRIDELADGLAAARVSAAAARDLLHRRRAAWVRLDGAALAAAVHRVGFAAATEPDVPVLTGLLLEVAEGEVRLVATDRYRLAVQTLPVRAGATGSAARVLDRASLLALAAWAADLGTVDLHVADDRVEAVAGSGERRLVGLVPGDFPDHRLLLSGLGRPTTRAAVPRQALLDVLDTAATSRLEFTPGGPLRAPEPVPAVVTGRPLSIAFQRSVLRPAVLAGVGPDVLLELTDPHAPAVLRSADDGTVTVLAMPTLLAPCR